MVDIADTALLISAVEERPEIWDTSNENFRNREAKERSWEEIGSNFIPNFTELDDELKKVTVVKLQKRWKTVRDAFKRTRAKAGTEAKKTSKYYDNLKFLEKNLDLTSGEIYYIDTDQTLREVLEQSDIEDEEFQPFQTQHKTEYSPRTRSKKICYEEKFMKSSVSKYDGDKSFLDSLLPTLQNFTEEQRLQFRIEVLNALQRVKNLLPNTPPERNRGTLKSFVLTPEGELKEEPKKPPTTAAERMRKMRERRRLEANSAGKNSSTTAERMRKMRQRCKPEADKPAGNAGTPEISTSVSRNAHESRDNNPNSKRIKLENESSANETYGEIDSVILIWTELLGYKLQEFDKLTREYLMNETDNNFFKAKIKMMKLNQGKEGRTISNSQFPVEVRYVDISNISVAQHQDQIVNVTTSATTAPSPSTQEIDKCEILYVNQP